jgi:hypothetical protein
MSGRESVTGGRIGLPIDDDYTAAVLYRLADGYAVRLAGLRGYSATDPRGDRDAIEAEAIRDIIHQYRVAGPADEAIIREAVEDALVGRRPRR